MNSTSKSCHIFTTNMAASLSNQVDPSQPPSGLVLLGLPMEGKSNYTQHFLLRIFCQKGTVKYQFSIPQSYSLSASEDNKSYKQTRHSLFPFLDKSMLVSKETIERRPGKMSQANMLKLHTNTHTTGVRPPLNDNQHGKITFAIWEAVTSVLVALFNT